MSKRLEKRKKMLEQQNQKKKQTKLLLGVVCLIIIVVGGYVALQYVSAPSEDPPEIKPTSSVPPQSEDPTEIQPTTSLFPTYKFTMKDIDGTWFSLNNYRGNVIVIHLMAVGCSGQINQINDNQLIKLKSLCNSYCDNKQVTIVSVAVATCENSRLSWLRSAYGISWFFGNDYDDGTVDIAQNYGVYGDGTIILIDKDFQVHEAYSDIGVPTLQSKINQLLVA